MTARRRTLAALVALASAQASCCGTDDNRHLREELVVTRGSKIGMGGTIEMPACTQPKTVEQLRAGLPKERIVELVGSPWRTLPAVQGELWVWDMEVYERHVLLAINVVNGLQHGDAVAEWRIIPDWMLHHNWLKPGMGVSRVVDAVGTPTRWEIVAGESCMVWEAAMQLVRQDHSWVYSPDTYLHSLRLNVKDDHLRSVEAIESRKLDAWPASAAQVAAGVATKAGR